MGINFYPAPTQDVSIVTTGNTVKVANATGGITSVNPLDVKMSGNLFKSFKGNSTNITGQSILTVGTSTALVIHSITISQNLTTNNPPDGSRLGVTVFANTTSTLSDNKILATNYEFDGTTFHNFPNGGVKLTAGDDLWVCADQYDALGLFYNFTVTIAYSEVTV